MNSEYGVALANAAGWGGNLAFIELLTSNDCKPPGMVLTALRQIHSLVCSEYLLGAFERGNLKAMKAHETWKQSGTWEYIQAVQGILLRNLHRAGNLEVLNYTAASVYDKENLYVSKFLQYSSPLNLPARVESDALPEEEHLASLQVFEHLKSKDCSFSASKFVPPALAQGRIDLLRFLWDYCATNGEEFIEYDYISFNELPFSPNSELKAFVEEVIERQATTESASTWWGLTLLSSGWTSSLDWMVSKGLLDLSNPSWAEDVLRLPAVSLRWLTANRCRQTNLQAARGALGFRDAQLAKEVCTPLHPIITYPSVRIHTFPLAQSCWHALFSSDFREYSPSDLGLACRLGFSVPASKVDQYLFNNKHAHLRVCLALQFFPSPDALNRLLESSLSALILPTFF